MSHATLRKFGWPHGEVAAYQYWSVLVRPVQATLGALALVNRTEATALSALPPAHFTELAAVTRDIETTLKSLFAFDRINYVMLMMVDPHVHFHVLPRYAGPRIFQGMSYADPAWPGAPNIAADLHMRDDHRTLLADALKAAWPS